VPITIVIVVAMTVVVVAVPPLPVALLVFSRKMAIVTMRLNAGLNHPLVVVTPLMFIPTMAVVIIRIGVVVSGATGGR